MNPTLLRLDYALHNSHLLSQWENGFVESLQEQYNKRGKLSPRQLEILERIEKQKLSEEARHASESWDANYDAEKRRIARICAEYYQTAGYFTALADSIIMDPSYIPSEKAWRKMCENKYAKKVIASYDAAPKYEVGSLVTFRATADYSHRIAAGDNPCIIISSGGSVKNAAKGSKPYTVLPYGAMKPITCEERHLKTFKKTKKKVSKKKETYNDVPF